MMNKLYPLSLLLIFFACAQKEQKVSDDTISESFVNGQFGFDLNFLKQHHPDLVLLGEPGSVAQVVVLPAYQARIMTSTATGLNGNSYGWVNHQLIASGKLADHISPFGGEDRIWLGPEGGQFSIFFKKDTPFTYENWFVPKEFDSMPFEPAGISSTEASFKKEMHLENYSGSQFDLRINRTIRLLTKESVKDMLSSAIPDEVSMVAFESENELTNIGQLPWSKKTGLLSIWVLSMFNASDSGMVAIPYREGGEKELGKVVTDDYFGKVPAERLRAKEGIIVFKADGNLRSKIGISSLRATPWICSYDAEKQLLTLSLFTFDPSAKDYVNSLWELQDKPYQGDVINSYNDGPQPNGEQLGKFFEIESSSAAVPLKPGESVSHKHRTIHLQGSKEALDQILFKTLSIHLHDISLN